MQRGLGFQDEEQEQEQKPSFLTTNVKRKTEDEDDYMSDKFLSAKDNVPEPKYTSSSKPRPKLVPVKTKPFAERERVSREEGLSSEIPEENKGFKLLKMMGYQQGMKMGKNENGIDEPIPLLVKRGRSGLGVEEEKRRKIDEDITNRVNLQKESVVSFKSRMSNKFNEKKTLSDLRSGLIMCKQMDTENGILESKFYKKEEECDSEEEVEKSRRYIVERPEFTEKELTEKLYQVLEYLRSNHTYCFYCGTQFTSQEDLASKCPGISEQDHE